MGDIINLRRRRKEKERVAKAEQAAANRLRFGHAAADRKLDEALAEKARRDLEAHKRDE
jgi:hypothetical protein